MLEKLTQMLATSKSLSLIEQKRLQWAREREEMVGLCGLWGKPRNENGNVKDQNSFYTRNNLLPPIQGKNEFKEPTKNQYKPEEESETSGYLSDSPKDLKQEDAPQEYCSLKKADEQLNNETVREEIQQQYWNESENYWADKKMYKNYKNEKWAHQNSESYICPNLRMYPSNKNFWYGTPESVSSDDGSRLRWGDRGVGVGHLWDPLINAPESRLPQVTDIYRPTPKWVEKGLKNADGNEADILIIHHPDEDHYGQPQKNYLLGQNVPIPREIIEERERKRKNALEHQNAIKKQLEERELKRKQERENRIKEERLEEERIKKEQEMERFRYEEEQRKIRQKEEIEKKKEEAMREAIEVAERRAKEEKKRNKRHSVNEGNGKNYSGNEKLEKLEKIMEKTEMGFGNKKRFVNSPRYGKGEEMKPHIEYKIGRKQSRKKLKDSGSQFEEIQLANNFQFLNLNGLPVEGGLALMLDNPPKDNNFLLPSEGVQLALLMSPRNSGSTNQLIPATPPVTGSTNTRSRILTPSKYRIAERMRFTPSNKSTQTDLEFSSDWIKLQGSRKKQSGTWGINSGSSGGSHKCNTLGRHHKHRCFVASKYRSKPHSSKLRVEDRPKWGINRPSVQYKKQSEKDPYYQKKIKARLKKTVEVGISSELMKNEDKELESVDKLLDYQTSEEEKRSKINEDMVLQNGYRMNSNLSSPVFVPMGSRLTSDWKESKKSEMESERSRSNDSPVSGENENEEEEEEDEDVVPSSVGFLTQTQLEAIKQIASLREGLKKLQKDYSNSRSITPFSDKSVEK